MVRNMRDLIAQAIKKSGGPSALARKANVSASTPLMWRSRGSVPAEHCPAVEAASGGFFLCEQMWPDKPWRRVRDASWPHPKGRPVLDFAAAPLKEAA